MPKVYGLVGWIGCGKDTAADFLVNKYNFARISYAQHLKDAVSAVFGWDRDLLEGRTDFSRAWRETVDPWWSTRLGIAELTPRWVLQHVGTDVFRNHFHPDIWVASTERAIQETLSQGQNVVISDCRFANEFDSINSLHGRLVAINRDQRFPIWYQCAKTQNIATPAELEYLYPHNLTMETLWPGVHASEWHWVGRAVHHEIWNQGTLDDLYAGLAQMMFSEFMGSEITNQVGISPTLSSHA